MQKIKVFPPDLIFMDIRLPGESGIELTKKNLSNLSHITMMRSLLKEFQGLYFDHSHKEQ